MSIRFHACRPFAHSFSSSKTFGILGTLGLFASAAFFKSSPEKSLSHPVKQLGALSLAALVAARHLRAKEKAKEKALLPFLQACEKTKTAITKCFVIINIDKQRLHVYKDFKWQGTLPISSAKKGTGQVEGSGQTPLGLHQISEKIGDGASPLAIFKSRVNTNQESSLEDRSNDHIVGRILWLEGLEEGRNKGINKEGKNVDSKNRYIYIHGTNRVDCLGIPASGGCVRLSPEHVVWLSRLLTEKTLVYIH